MHHHKIITVLVVELASVFVYGCMSSPTISQQENAQQDSGIEAIIRNQPAANLGGHSRERDFVNRSYLLRNQPALTYAYIVTQNKVYKLCNSSGYAVPYSTQLTNPHRVTPYEGANYGQVVSNPEINSLYPPSDAAATLVGCIVDDKGGIGLAYVESEVLVLPYEIQHDIDLSPKLGSSSYAMDMGKSSFSFVTADGRIMIVDTETGVVYDAAKPPTPTHQPDIAPTVDINNPASVATSTP